MKRTLLIQQGMMPPAGWGKSRSLIAIHFSLWCERMSRLMVEVPAKVTKGFESTLSQMLFKTLMRNIFVVLWEWQPDWCLSRVQCLCHVCKTQDKDKRIKGYFLMKGRTLVFLKLDRKETGDNEFLIIKYKVQLSGWPLSDLMRMVSKWQVDKGSQCPCEQVSWKKKYFGIDKK